MKTLNQETNVRRRAGSYPAAILWIALNDDTEWLDEPGSSPSVTAALVADIFQRSPDEVVEDLRAAVRREQSGRTRLDQARAYARCIADQDDKFGHPSDDAERWPDNHGLLSNQPHDA